MASIDKKIDKLTEAIEKLVNNPIAPIAPIAPVLPIAPIIEHNQGDHDLLTKLDTKVDQIQLDVSELKRDKNIYVNQTEHGELCKIITDHENRVRILEKSMWKWIGVSSTIAASISMAIVLAARLIK